MCNMTLYIKANMLWMLFVQKKKLENNFIVGVEPCLKYCGIIGLLLNIPIRIGITI